MSTIHNIDKATVAINHFEANLATLANKMMVFGQTHAPQAWKLALAAAKVMAFQIVLNGFILLLLCGVCVLLAKYLAKKGTSFKEDDDETFIPLYIISGLLILASVGLLIGGLSQVANAWAWTGLFHPTVYIAGKVLGLQ